MHEAKNDRSKERNRQFTIRVGNFPRIPLGCKSSLNKFKKTEIIQSKVSDHNRIKLYINQLQKEI